jgi:diguanylate cyclase (GGDEF)-like protein
MTDFLKKKFSFKDLLEILSHLNNKIKLLLEVVLIFVGFFLIGFSSGTLWFILKVFIFTLVLILIYSNFKTEVVKNKESENESLKKTELSLSTIIDSVKNIDEKIIELSPEKLNEQRLETERDFNIYLENILDVIKSTVISHSAVVFWINYFRKTLVVRAKVTDSQNFVPHRHIDMNFGLLGIVVKEKRTVMELDITRSSEILHYYYQDERIRSFIATPIFLDSRGKYGQTKQIIGVLVVDSQVKDAFGEEDKLLIEKYSEMISKAVHTYNQLYEIELNARVANALYSFSNKLNVITNFKTEDVVEVLAETVKENFEFDRLSVAISKNESKTAVINKVIGQHDEFIEGFEFPVDEGLSGWVIKHNKSIIIPDLDRGDFFIPRYTKREKTNHKLRSFFGVPIGTEKKCFGMISLESRKPNFYGDNHKRLMQIFANSAALSLERVELYKQLEELATTDGLTKLINHRTFMEILENEMSRAKRFGTKLSLMMMDIDFFKKFNDKYGHLVGDFVLSEVAKTIKESVRKIDIVARYGGEEFTLLLIETSAKNSNILAERIRQKIESKDYVTENGLHLKITMSIGICEILGNIDNKTLIANADAALYVAKSEGRNCVRIFNPKEIVYQQKNL